MLSAIDRHTVHQVIEALFPTLVITLNIMDLLLSRAGCFSV